MTVSQFATAIAGVDYRDRGMWFSELYLFLSLCVAAGVDLVIESGVKHGTSTRTIAAVGIPLISVDVKSFVVGRLPGVTFVTGLAQTVIPPMLKRHRDRRIGVLLDGPKGPVDGVGFVPACLASSAVHVVGCHDVKRGHGESRHSHEPDFRAASAVLDTKIPRTFQRACPDGPGLGVWLAQERAA